MTALLHYASITEDVYLPLHLNLQMGLTNTSIEVFQSFVEDECEPLSLGEDNSRARVNSAIVSVERLRQTREMEEIAIKASSKGSDS
jgi:hypothetical protein